jgi:hypothetical protein
MVAGVAGGLAIGACGLSISGTGAVMDDGLDATQDAVSMVIDAADGGGARLEPQDGLQKPSDAGADAPRDGAAPGDAEVPDAGPPCVPLDGAMVGSVDTGAMTLRGGASPDQRRQGLISLTESEHDQRGAAWSSNALPPLRAFQASFALRVGPNDTAGDGIAFAVLGASAPLEPGEDGSGLGLRGVGAPGFAVAVDMFRDSNDPTDDGGTTLKLIAMPSFEVIAHVRHAESLNDGALYQVDVALEADGTLEATLHGRAVTTKVRHTHAAFRVPSPAILGATAATGDASNSHNELVSITIAGGCL